MVGRAGRDRDGCKAGGWRLDGPCFSIARTTVVNVAQHHHDYDHDHDYDHGHDHDCDDNILPMSIMQLLVIMGIC